jgi:hypothetical protein
MPSVADAFAKHVLSVTRLMNFDRDVLDFAINVIRPLPERLKKLKIDNPELTGERALQVLSQIRENDSLRLRYQTIFNQALVLLVSYFASSVHDLFRHAVRIALRGHDNNLQLFREDLRLSLGVLKDYDYDLKDVAPDLLIQAKEISFQDMQSIARSFKSYLEITIEKDPNVNDIIVAQGCRHVIVHEGGRVNERLLRQVAKAVPRKVKQELSQGDYVQFDPSEVEKVADAMSIYIERVAALISERFGEAV